MKEDARYGIKLTILCTVVWFTELLDGAFINFALPTISKFFSIDSTDAEWALIGFTFAMTIGMLSSLAFSDFFGSRKTYLGGLWIYFVSSFACGLSFNYSQLVIYRFIQGFGTGISIPIGMTLILAALPHHLWVKMRSWSSLSALLAPAIAPILAGYIIILLNWRWLFFIKLPLVFICILLGHFWIRKSNPIKKILHFDWLGFLTAVISIALLLWVFSEIGKPVFSNLTLMIMFALSIFLFAFFIWQQKRALHPLIPISLFRYPSFNWGSLVHIVVNVIFLGATYLISLYFQFGLGFTLLKTGWLMTALTAGMTLAIPFTVSLYPRVGSLSCILSGLTLLAISMLGLVFVQSETPSWLIASLIFFEGLGASLVLTLSFVIIFKGIPENLRSSGSAVYALFKQLASSLGVAITIMVLTISMHFNKVDRLTETIPPHLFHPSLIVLGLLPIGTLLCCILNRKIYQHKSSG